MVARASWTSVVYKGQLRKRAILRVESAGRWPAREESPDFIEHGARRKPGRGDPTESATETNRRHKSVRVKW